MLRLALTALALAACAAAATTSASAQAPVRPTEFATGIFDPYMVMQSGPAMRDLAFDQTRAAGGTVVRLLIDWGDVAPTEPGFDARDPGHPGYKWARIDAEVQSAVARGLSPILDIYNAPRWAMDGRGTFGIYDGPINPQAAPFGDFAYAAARRYSGTFVPPGASAPLPRVRYWQAWNEPNLGMFLLPQIVGGVDVAVDRYRALVSAFSAAVHAVAADNLVVAGSTTPFGGVPAEFTIPPLRFMRKFLCLSDGPQPVPTCNTPIAFDVWAHQPYTAGGPSHKAPDPEDVELGDLPRMKALLDAAQRHRLIVSNGPVRFWVTEFSWDSHPQDPYGVPTATLQRWIPEAFYRMWLSGVSLITWFKIRDEPYATNVYQSGLWAWDGGGTYTPKPLVTVFRFPFVAIKSRKRIIVWGRTPTSQPGMVTIERGTAGGWVAVANVQANASGLFHATPIRPSALGDQFRARFGTEVSHPFTIGPTPDQRYAIFGLFFDDGL